MKLNIIFTICCLLLGCTSVLVSDVTRASSEETNIVQAKVRLANGQDMHVDLPKGLKLKTITPPPTKEEVPYQLEWFITESIKGRKFEEAALYAIAAVWNGSDSDVLYNCLEDIRSGLMDEILQLKNQKNDFGPIVELLERNFKG